MPQHKEVIAASALSPLRSVEFSVFDAESGRLLRRGQAQFCDMAGQAAAPNEVVMEGTYPDDEYRIEVGEDGPSAVEWAVPIIVTRVLINAEARRRIEAVYPAWMQMNIMREGDTAAISKMGDFIRSVVAASNALTEPFPADYASDVYWKS